MSTRPADVAAYLRSPEGVKLFRYSATSLVSLAVSETCLVIFDGVLGLRPVLSSSLATAIAAVPSYWLNRRWAWGRAGKSHMWREVVPFWVLAFLGWGLSTLAVWGAARWATDHHSSHVVHTGLVAFAYVAAFGVLWVGKFVIFNRLLFIHHHHDVPAGVAD